MPAFRRPWNRHRAVYRAPSPAAAAVSVQPLETRVLLSSITVGFYNSAFWGAASRIYPADPNPSDTAVPGIGAADVGAIRLNDFAPPDPADPLGIAARNPDAVAVFDQDFSYTHTPITLPPSIRPSQFSTALTGRITVPSDGDNVPDEQHSMAFWGTQAEAHVYVDGRLVWTNPNQGQSNSSNLAPARLYREGQSLDVVMLAGQEAMLRWSIGGGVFSDIPASALHPVPSVPQKSGLVLAGEPTARQVTFTIVDNSTSEQRFELYRKHADAPDAAYVKVNEAGINSPLITDASALPATSYTYVLRGHNFASGTGEASDPVSVTTAAESASRQGLHAYYYNDDFWGRGEPRPQPRFGDLFVGPGAGVWGADAHEIVTSASLISGDAQHDPAVRPGGSPNPLIRDNSHSIILAGKLRVDEPGLYQVLGFGDDDTYAIVNNVITSAYPGLHVLFNPRPSTNNADRFVHTVHLDAGEHDLLVLNSDLTGASALELRWVRPGQTAPELIPDANLRTGAAAPAAPSAPQATEMRGTSALITMSDNATNEWKNVLLVARDADFTQDVRTFPLGIRVETGAPEANNFASLRVMNLSPNTRYFAKHLSLNVEGDSASPVTEFNTGDEQVPAVPARFAARPRGPGEINVTWDDPAFDETGFVVQRRLGNGEFADLVTLPVDTRSYLDKPDPAQVPAGISLEYRVASFNDIGRSPSGVRGLVFGGAGGTGLRQRIYDNIHATAFEPTVAHSTDRVDPYVNYTWGEGAPAPGIGVDTFAIEWVGEIYAEETKAYDFSFTAGGFGGNGVRLFLDDVLVAADGWRDEGAREAFSEPVHLTAGQKVKVRLQYYNSFGSAAARLRWNGPDGREEIPSVFLFPTVGPAEAVDQVARRPVGHATAFGLPPVPSTGRGASIGLRWQDNAFGETGYEIQRATDGAFTRDLTTFSAGPGADQFVDASPIDRERTYYYRVRPQGATDGAWVVAGPVGASRFDAGRDFTVPDFGPPRHVTVNGDASMTAETTLKLVHDDNFRFGSAFINRSFDVATDFKVNFDFQISNSTGADGMAFVIHNHLPGAAGVSQLNALGSENAGGSGLGYAGIPNSVAITFDIHDKIDHLGLFTNGSAPPFGNVPATRANDPAQYPLQPNGTIDLRLEQNGAIDLNNGAVFDFTATYNSTLKVLSIEIRHAGGDPTLPPLFTTQFAIDIATVVGGDEAVMGFSAANGGFASRHEVHNFSYDPVNVATSLPVSEIYVRGSSWLGNDNSATNTTFMEYLEAKGLGDDVFGYRLYANAAPTTGPFNNPEQILPWINMDEIVLRYIDAPTGGLVPTPGTLTVSGLRNGSYTITSVTPIAGDPTAYVLRLAKPLGGGDPNTGEAPTVTENGDRITLTVPGGAAGSFSLRMNVLQGDVDHLIETTHNVLARDYAEVKKRFFKNTNQAPSDPDTDYTPFHDVDGNGQILARDFAEVKKRFFQSLPAVAAAGGASLDGSSITSQMFASERILA